MEAKELPEAVWGWRELADGEDINVGDAELAVLAIRKKLGEDTSKEWTKGIIVDGKYYKPGTSGIFAMQRCSKTIVLERVKNDLDAQAQNRALKTLRFNSWHDTIVGGKRVLVDLPEWELMRHTVERNKAYRKKKYDEYKKRKG